jgi:hypothetical protein
MSEQEIVDRAKNEIIFYRYFVELIYIPFEDEYPYTD